MNGGKPMKYDLYEDAKNTPIVEKGIDQAIYNFINALKDINKTFPKTGMDDTASKEKIAEIVSNEIFEEV
jgi:hypothetical protein